MRAIVGAKIVTPHGILENGVLHFDTHILSIDDTPHSNATVTEVQDLFLAPGFIDLHIHGSGGADTMDATHEALERISTHIAACGVSSFLPTTMSRPFEEIEAAIEAVARYGNHLSGAKALGVHLEGPFLNPKRCGAQEAAHIVGAEIDLVARHAETIRMITLAPEMQGHKVFIEEVKARFSHIVIAAGHSDARYDEACEAFRAGVSHVTHLFNAMRPYHHREPGLIGALFDDPRISADIIADLVHTHPHHLRLAKRMLPDRLALITDAMRAGCLHEGNFRLGGQAVHVKEGAARLADGTLAGSVLRFNDALRHFCKATDATIEEAVYAAATLPATLLGLKKGRIVQGYDADLVLFDQNFAIIETIVAGRSVYRSS